MFTLPFLQQYCNLSILLVFHYFKRVRNTFPTRLASPGMPSFHTAELAVGGSRRLKKEKPQGKS